MTMLSTRTIRNYIKLGLLDGNKINGYWQFTDDKITKFMNNDYVSQSLNAKRNVNVNIFLYKNWKIIMYNN